MDTLLNRVHLKYLGYENCFMTTRISKLKENDISMDQDRYVTSVVSKYLDIATIKIN